MRLARKRHPRASLALACLFALAGATRCGPPSNKEDPSSSAERPTLRIGISNVPQLTTDRGMQAFLVNMTNEGLLRVNQEGRVEPWLAESWQRSADGRRLSLRLRQPTVMFHDGQKANAEAIVAILND